MVKWVNTEKIKLLYCFIINLKKFDFDRYEIKYFKIIFKEIFRVLNYIVNSKVISWKKIQKLMIDSIVIYDKDNKRKKICNKIKKSYKA